MFIIFIAHLPLNPWNNWIPARFGPSDATEMFVFCSGFASAIAFGGRFRRHGFAIGTLRIAHRCWQVYWSHLGLFLTVAASACWAPGGGGVDYVEALYLQHFFAEPQQGIVGLVTLTYVPNYFDILPMYIVVLAMVPVVMALARLGPAPRTRRLVTLYLAQSCFGWDLPAEWWSDRAWFFDPFGWQLIFFTGFAFGSGWLPEPPRRRAPVLAGAPVRRGDGAAELAAPVVALGVARPVQPAVRALQGQDALRHPALPALSWPWPMSPCRLIDPFRERLAGRLGGADRAGRPAGAARVSLEHGSGLRAGHGAGRGRPQLGHGWPGQSRRLRDPGGGGGPGALRPCPALAPAGGPRPPCAPAIRRRCSPPGE